MYMTSLLGLAYGISHQTKMNHIGQRIFGDIVNVVEVALPENASLAHHEHLKIFVAQGIDFIYDDSCHKLKIQIRHSRVHAQSDLVSTKLNLNLDLSQHIIDAAPMKEGNGRTKYPLVLCL